MEILLKKDVDRIGSKDEIVTVKNGFGRNYLIPKGMAILATESVKKMNSETLKQRAHKFNQLKDEALKILDKLSKKTFEVPAKVGENGKIFGSISNIQLADAMDKAGFKIERKNITLPTNNLKSVGKFEADIIFHKEVSGKISFEIVED
jgi:large subunit ribosomal protein L9